jgi:hypothetical protein
VEVEVKQQQQQRQTTTEEVGAERRRASLTSLPLSLPLSLVQRAAQSAIVCSSRELLCLLSPFSLRAKVERERRERLRLFFSTPFRLMK